MHKPKLASLSLENFGAHNACVVVAREAGDYTVATSMHPPEQCQVYEYVPVTVHFH